MEVLLSLVLGCLSVVMCLRCLRLLRSPCLGSEEPLGKSSGSVVKLGMVCGDSVSCDEGFFQHELDHCEHVCSWRILSVS